MGDPRSFKGAPLKVTCVPGWDEALSMAILDFVVAQPRIRKISKIESN
jgi:hypothetical protein